MLAYDERKQIFDGLPSQYTITYPDSVTHSWDVTKLYTHQDNRDTYPCVTLQYVPSSILVWEPLTHKWVINPDVKVDDSEVINYDGSDSLLKVGDVYSIVSVDGTLSGSPHTFVGGTDYELGDDNQTLEWLGADVPDMGTDYTVGFKKNMMNVVDGEVLDDTLMINVYAETSTVGGTVYPGQITADYLANEVKRWFRYLFNFDFAIVVSASQIRNLDSLIAEEYLYRRQFNVMIRHHETYTHEYPRIVEVDETYSHSI